MLKGTGWLELVEKAAGACSEGEQGPFPAHTGLITLLARCNVAQRCL